ncbi:hypothetical protein [Nocardia sp. CA-290969]|uniref:hypothetical protein n=1 Tax=Nocardia sp. CA-290969 TaxID=3239986 RepID=UPI003D8B5BE7
MSTPQDPRNPGGPPRESGGEPPRQPGSEPRHHAETPGQHSGEPSRHGDETPVGSDRGGPDEQRSADRTPETPDEPFVTPTAPQPPDDTQTPRQSPQVPHEPSTGAGDQAGAEEAPGRAGTERGPAGETPAYSEDPPTEYLPKILHRETGTGGGRTGAAPEPESPEAGAAGSPADDHPTRMLPKPEERGGEAPQLDKGTAAYTHGWQPGSTEPQPGGGPGGEIPPQAWSARPEEQTPGQAWQPQSPGQPGYPQPGGAPYPGAYGGQPGGRPGQPGAQSGWGAKPGEQPGWGAPEEQSGWGGRPGQQDWGGQPGQQGWGTQPGQQGWAAQPGQQGWGGQQSGDYPAYPQQQYQPYGATQQPERSGPQVLSIIGFVCAAVSLLFCPLVFGIAGIILGVVGHIRGESLGKWAAIAAGVCLVAGILLAWALYGLDVVPIESAR